MMFLLLVTLTSMLLAAVMSVIAWRIANDERRRSEARVAALAADIHEGDTGATTTAAGVDDFELRPADGAFGAGLFAEREPRSGPSRATALAAGMVALAGAVALVVLFGGGSNVGARGVGQAQPAANAAARPAAKAAAQPATPAPLELVALGHERDGDRLIVRGIVRNPRNGLPAERLAAVVFLFNRDGGFLTSGRVSIDTSALRPGGETPFVVTVPGAADVGRYRVSFRADDRIVPHVDRRDAQQAKLQDHA